MSFQAYLDKGEEETGLTPQQIGDRAHERGYGAETKAGEILAWLVHRAASTVRLDGVAARSAEG